MKQAADRGGRGRHLVAAGAALLRDWRRCGPAPPSATSAPLDVTVILLACSLRGLPLAGPAGLCRLAVADPARARRPPRPWPPPQALHLWRRNVVLSCIGGTAVNVVLASPG